MSEESLFYRVLEQPVDQRAAFLASECSDESLRRRVMQLVDAHSHPAGFLEAAVGPAGQRPIAHAEVPGTRIGRYRLIEPIGEGGMGVVYLAEQEEPMRRPVAVKVIKPGMDSRHVIARFEAERQALALMDHPNIARVLDAGFSGVRSQQSRVREPGERSSLTPDPCLLTADGGRPYFVMELCRGMPITDHCEQHHLRPRERLGLFVTVCQAVQHAHLKGIIHRDLKPTNVLVVPEGNAESGGAAVKVIDFGIAKALGHELTDKTLTVGGTQLLGTPMYTSPEQAELAGDVDTRTDIYSLGVLLYEMLTGVTPFDRERLRAASFDEVRRIIRHEEPPRPSTRVSTLGHAATTVTAHREIEPRRLSRLLRGELDWIVMKALEKDRNRRYETVGALAADVARYLQDRPVTARPPSVWYRSCKYVRRHRAALGIVTAIIAVLSTAAAGVGWALWDRAAREAARAEEMSKRLHDTEVTVDAALVRFDLLRHEAMRGPRTTSQDTRIALQGWAQAEAALGQAEAALHAGVASEAQRRRVQFERNELECGRDGDDRLHQQLVRKEQLFRDLEQARLTEQDWVNNQFDFAGASAKYAAAFAAFGLRAEVGHLGEARHIAQEEFEDIRTVVIDALDHWCSCAGLAKQDALAKNLRAIADTCDSDPWRRRVRAARAAKDLPGLRTVSAEARNPTVSPTNLAFLAGVLFYNVDRAEGVALLRWARTHHPTDFHIHSYLATFLMTHPPGSPDPPPLVLEEAAGCYRTAIALRPSVGVVYSNLALVLLRQNRPDEAITASRQAIDLNNRYAPAHDALGAALAARCEWDEAVAAYSRAIAIDPQLAGGHRHLGVALAATGRQDEAIKAFRVALAHRERSAIDYHNLGLALMKRDKLEEAIGIFREEIGVAPKRPEGYDDLGEALAAKHDLDAALTAFRQAISCDAKFRPAYLHIGNALLNHGQFIEAIDAYRQALAIDSSFALARLGLGMAFVARNEWDAAITELRKACELDPKLAVAQHSLGGACLRAGRFDEAVAPLRAAIVLDRSYARSHACWFALGTCLSEKSRFEEAAAAFRSAADLDPSHGPTRLNLGRALLNIGRFAEGCAALREALGLLKGDDPDRRQAVDVLRFGERLLALEARLLEVLAGTSAPKDNRERLDLVTVCQFSNRNATGCRLYADAFAVDARLADDFKNRHRYRAVRFAILAGTGRGIDVGTLTDADRARLRQQGLDWLRAELASCRACLDSGPVADRPLAQARLQHCQANDNLRAVRDADALAKLPEVERQAWRTWWAAVAAVLGKTNDQ
jgi:serine/threonine protein kinase/tetratricopeptide (TPR) repeat protein